MKNPVGTHLGIGFLVLWLFGMVFTAIPTQAQGIVFSPAPANPALRACVGPLLDPEQSMTEHERKAAQFQVYECIRRWEAWRQLACDGAGSEVLVREDVVPIFCSVSWQKWQTMEWRR